MLFSVATVAVAADRLYGPQDPPVRELARLYRVAAEPFPTVSFPLSTAWLYEAALELRTEAAGAGFAEALDDYIERLGYAPREVRTGFDLEFRPEAYLETTYLREGIAEKLRREDPALRIRVSGGVDDGPLLHTAGVAVRAYATEYPSNLTPPQRGDPIPYEFNNVYEGYFHWPLEFIAFTFGRQKLDLGPAPRSSISLAGRIPYHDALRITMDLGPIRMHHLISSIDNFEARNDVVLPPESGPGPSRDVYDFDRNQIFFNTHYFEYRFDSWRLGVGANLVVSRELNNFNLADFFPVFSWHNASLIPHNMAAFLDATVPVASGLELYGQAAFDDIRTSSTGIGDSPVPTIPAGTVGARYTHLSSARVWDAAVDLGYTHYLWGNFDREYGLSRALFRLRTEGDGGYAIPLTSPYGPGTLFALADAEVSNGPYTLGLLYEIVARKPDANLFTTELAESDRLAGQTYRVLHRVEAAGTYRFTPWARASMQPGILVADGEAEAYLDIGAVISYSGSRTVATVDR
jgi:hypothetical protein